MFKRTQKLKWDINVGDLGSSVLCYISHSLNQINSKKNGRFAHLDLESKCVTAFYLTFIQIKWKL
jgi:hypothetical protein